MIEIKTQTQFDTMKAGLISSPVTYQKQTILIYPISGGYQITSALKIQNSSLKIVGVNKPIIKLTSTGTDEIVDSVISVIGASGSELEKVIIKGLHLTGNGKSSSHGAHGINIQYCGKAPTTGLTTGTSRYDSATVGNTIVNKIGVRIEDCVVEETRLYGIYLNSSSNNTITANTVQNNNGYGIRLYSSSNNNTITANTVQNNNGYGIYLNSSSNNTITTNTVQNNNSYGICLNSSSNNTITTNTVQNNNSYGIYLSSSSNNIIGSNEVLNNLATGVYLYGTANNYNNILSNLSIGNTTSNYTSDGGTGNIANINTTS